MGGPHHGTWLPSQIRNRSQYPVSVQSPSSYRSSLAIKETFQGPLQGRCWNGFPRRRRCIKLAWGCTIFPQELRQIVKNQFTNRRPSICVPRIYGNGARAGNLAQPSHLPLQQSSTSVEGTLLVPRRSPSYNALNGCPIQKDPSPCHLPGPCGLCPAQRRRSTCAHIKNSTIPAAKSITKTGTCRNNSVLKGQWICLSILILFHKGTDKSFGVRKPPTTEKKHVSVWMPYGTIHVRSNETSSGLRLNHSVHVAAPVRTSEEAI